jgi:hypothetical protein
MKKFDFKTLLVMILLIICTVALGIFIWMTSYPYQPIVIQQPIEIKNTNKQVKAGDLLIYKIKYEKKMNVSGKLSRKLVNSYKIDLADSIVTAPIGHDCDQVKIQIPKFADPGIYYLWWSTSYQVNPLRIITVSVESEKFEIVK